MWQVQVRRHGFQHQNRTFQHKADALTWARKIESEIDRLGLPADYRQLRSLSFGELLRRYEREVTPRKRSAAIEHFRIKKALADPISRISLAKLLPKHVAEYRDRRLAHVSQETVRKDLSLFRHLFEVARRDWGIALSINPASDVIKPLPSRPRDRRLAEGELERLLRECERSRCPWLRPLLLLAVATGMRRGEILNLRWRDIDLDKRLAFLPVTKTGEPRTVPLSPEALGIISGMPQSNGDRLFPVSPNAVRLAWTRLTRKAGIEGLHFHDLRHEAISRLFEQGLSLPEVALVSGHRDPRMLFRYTHLSPALVAKKMSALSADRKTSNHEARQIRGGCGSNKPATTDPAPSN